MRTKGHKRLVADLLLHSNSYWSAERKLWPNMFLGPFEKWEYVYIPIYSLCSKAAGVKISYGFTAN